LVAVGASRLCAAFRLWSKSSVAPVRAATETNQHRPNKALHPTAYSSVPCARKLASVSSLPAAGELVVGPLREMLLQVILRLMESSGKYYKPVWEFIANIIDNSNEFFTSTSIVAKEQFDGEFQSLKTHLLDDLAGPTSFQFQKIAPLLDEIENTNVPHPIFRKSVWVNKSKIAKTLDQIIAFVPQSLWTEIEVPPANVEEPTPKQELGSPLGIALGAILFLAMLAFLYVNITTGTKRERDTCIMLIFMGIISVLIRIGVIKQKWVERAWWIFFAIMCIGGPMFAIFFVGKFFGWW
jgi:hypothetical protein